MPPTANRCPLCGQPADQKVLDQAHDHAFWTRSDGACPACVQQELLRTLLNEGHAALHHAVQTHWPLDPEAAFGALPTPLRLHADPRFTGRGVTIAVVDSGFYPHPDLILPENRIRAWCDVGRDPATTLRFARDATPRWPGWDASSDHQWHGTMTSVAAAGNGYLSQGLYRGLASGVELVLPPVRDRAGRITDRTIAAALDWILRHREEFGIRVATLSVSGDGDVISADNPVDRAVAALVDAGVVVVAAAGNAGERRLIPPATAPRALTIGGLDDRNLLTYAAYMLWHSNYGASSAGAEKPELVAPSIWVAAPVLPGTGVAREAAALFADRRNGERGGEGRIAELKLITPHYQHVDGTSFAAPVVASAVACMLDANPALTPGLVRDALVATAHPVPGASRERQGAGALDAGRAVAQALKELHSDAAGRFMSPLRTVAGVAFALHDHAARQVEVVGSWNEWRAPGLAASETEVGLWCTAPLALAHGNYGYKFLLDGTRWLDDPDNPSKTPDGLGGLNSRLVVPPPA